MCGILCQVSHGPQVGDPTVDQSLRRRGPDAFGEERVALEGGVEVKMAASVLHLRGDLIGKQPSRDGSSVLLWNGQVYGGSVEVPLTESDTPIVHGALSSAEKGDAEGGILNVLLSIEGPYSFVYLSIRSRRVYFGRDPFARRSLLIRKCPPKSNLLLTLASVMPVTGVPEEWEELPAHGVYWMELGVITSILTLNHIPWPAMAPTLVHSDEVFQGGAESLRSVLRDAVRRRVSSWSLGRQGKGHVAVLFSGGLDSTVLAGLVAECALAEEQKVTIDLLNVCFDALGGHQSPDRQSSRASWKDLRAAYPCARWRLVCIDVCYDDLLASDSLHRIQQTMAPGSTVMDFNIAAAFWCGARGSGIGYLHDDDCGTPYTSAARALIIGNGADEQLAGYTRHRTAFHRGGERALLSEMSKDIERLWLRNLGRDDRVIADHGREARSPFLDEHVVRYIRNLHLSLIADLSKPPGVGDKMVLRQVALDMGLTSCSNLQKRAIQFGSRISRASKTTWGKEGGMDSSKLHFPSTTVGAKGSEDVEAQHE
jgi:asparagine synthetase B (glutamine-hydrolysing)